MSTRRYICDAKKEDKCTYRGKLCRMGKPHSHSSNLLCHHNECDYSSKNRRIRCVVLSTDIDILFDELLYDFGEREPQDIKPRTKKSRTKKPRTKKPRTSEDIWDTGEDVWI
jgi:hypothetical protein